MAAPGSTETDISRGSLDRYISAADLALRAIEAGRAGNITEIGNSVLKLIDNIRQSYQIAMATPELSDDQKVREFSDEANQRFRTATETNPGLNLDQRNALRKFLRNEVTAIQAIYLKPHTSLQEVAATAALTAAESAITSSPSMPPDVVTALREHVSKLLDRVTAMDPENGILLELGQPNLVDLTARINAGAIKDTITRQRLNEMKPKVEDFARQVNAGVPLEATDIDAISNYRKQATIMMATLEAKKDPDEKGADELQKMVQLLDEIQHRHFVLELGEGSDDRNKFLRPSRKTGLSSGIIGPAQMFIGSFADQLVDAEIIGRHIAQTSPAERARLYNTDPTVLSRLNALKREMVTFADRQERMKAEANLLLTREQRNDSNEFIAYTNEYVTWLNNLIDAITPPPGGPGAPGERNVAVGHMGEPPTDDKIAWDQYFEAVGKNFSIEELRERFVERLDADLGSLKVADIFRTKPQSLKFDSLIAYLTKRGAGPPEDDGAKKLATFFTERIALFDAFNPHGLSSALIGDIVKFCTEARAGGFDRHVYDYFLGLNENAGKNYEHALILNEQLNIIEDTLFEAPDPDYRSNDEGGTEERPPTEWDQPWGPTHTFLDNNGNTVVREVPAHLIGQPKGRFIKGYFSFFTGNWMSPSEPIRDRLKNRILIEVGPKFQAENMTKEGDQKGLTELSIEMAGALNVRGYLFAICYAIGMSPPGGIGDVIDLIKESCPMAVEFNEAARNVRLIPTIVEGLEIPQAFWDQMTFMLLEGTKYSSKDKRDDTLSRWRILQESIRVSTLKRKQNEIPVRHVIDMVNINGEKIEGHDIDHMGLHRLQPGERPRDKVIILPWLYQDLRTCERGPIGKKMNRRGTELITWNKGREAFRDFEHSIEDPITATGDVNHVKEQLSLDLFERLKRTSLLKQNDLPGDLIEVGELYHRRIGYLNRFFAKDHDPLAQSPMRMETNVPNPNPIDKFFRWKPVRLVVSLLSGKDSESLVTMLRHTIENEENIDWTWGPKKFHDPLETPGHGHGHGGHHEMYMKSWLIAHLPVWRKDREAYWKLRYFTRPSRYQEKKHIAEAAELRLSAEDNRLFEASYDHVTLQKKQLAAEKQAAASGEGKTKH
jgi:hypothetical protein